MADAQRICSIEGCDGEHAARALCRYHYDRARRLHTLPPRTRVKPEGPCAVDGCDKPAFAKGMCGMHYRRMRALT